MICLRCGYCCVHYDVIIVVDASLGIVDGNLAHKPAGERCPHLVGDTPGSYSCAIHDEPWYPETPCAAFTQIEAGNTPCRIGAHVLQGRATK